ncbi:uncharacterized protein LOC131164899 isoform X2 [Malania oleifera]|uniref:uncharacterized protein LOC131164899 isoform X2 n=1 Tax=Malania oleifera TaxID=397392 RepID=UPI0025AE7E88|nr:uncharacterized protein LOC131164899 isoform X2 [Malania oleifera]
MSAIETHPMAVHVASLVQSFRQVPPAAVPVMLDCVMASAGLAPSSLFYPLIDSFHLATKESATKQEKLDSDQCNYISSFMRALCHLLKKLGANHGALELFIFKCYIPLTMMVHGYAGGILNETSESFLEVLIATNTWEILEATLVRMFLRSVGLSMGMYQNDKLTMHGRSSCTTFEGSHEKTNYSELNKESPFVPFPLALSCYILTSLLDAALQSHGAVESGSELMSANGCYVKKFSVNLLWDLCNMSVQMLSQTLECRSCAVGSFLPCIFKAFVLHDTFEVLVNGQRHVFSRKHFFMKLWMCCKTLFCLGPAERRDAYSVLSLYLSFFSDTAGYGDAYASHGAEEFDVIAEKDFWNEIKRGLVDKEGLVRKQCLHILKMVLNLNEGNECYSGSSAKVLHENSSIQHGVTKRELWAEKEAKSLGVGKICNSVNNSLSGQRRWEAFLLLYEMLEEYGTHLVEAAWNHQITLLLQFSSPNDEYLKITTCGVYENQMGTLEGIFNWLGVLWERGLCHDNPQVRCLIMQSFLGIEWKTLGSCTKFVPENFVLGPFIWGLNDPVHHKDFGLKGVYTSRMIEGASKFLHQYTSHLSVRVGISFLSSLASLAKQHSFGRVGLMGLAKCIASAACGVRTHSISEENWCKDALDNAIQEKSAPRSLSQNDKTQYLEVLRFLIESSKQHFNPNYRLQGILRVKVQEWLVGSGNKYSGANSCTKMQLLTSLLDFPKNFISHQFSVGFFDDYDDQDLDSWGSEAERWARVLFLVIKEEHDLEPTLMLLENHGINICKMNKHLDWKPVKFLILILSLVQELQIMQYRATDYLVKKVDSEAECGSFERVGQLVPEQDSILFEKFAKCFLSILDDLISFANLSCSIFWSSVVIEDTILPSSVTGKLGGPSQRRLSSSMTTSVLQAIASMRTVASVSSWCAQFKNDALLDFSFTFLWNFFWKIVSSPACDSETGAEIFVAAYEALAAVLKALVSALSPSAFDLMCNDKSLLPQVEGKPLLDTLVLAFLQNINNLLTVGVLVRTRRATLMNWKWLCLESLLAIPAHAAAKVSHLENSIIFFSESTVKFIFGDLVESLENAGEVSILPILRSVRLVQGLLASGRLHSAVSSCDDVDTQMVWKLVRSSWILHISCNKRRVAAIAALLSSVLHFSLFSEERMHVNDNAPGPLKWFIEKVLEEGTKSPRTIRLAALHLSGLWLSNPKMIKYYINELKLLSLYGSVAFDEDFEAELAENHDARIEVSLLANSPEPELTEAFINTELYARVSIAVLFYKLADLADMVGSTNENDDCHAARESGKLFLLDLLDAVVNEKDLSKELYKKYSAIHRRKVRAWQMICILSRFVDEDIVQQVARNLHICLYRNNFPGVRQYLETFAVHIYLKFPSLAKEQLVPIFQDYDMRPQALSSYVFITANVIIHTHETARYRHLDDLLPPVIPLLTSHHHSLRAFTQLLVYQVLWKLLPALGASASESISLEKRCFEDFKLYLAKNSDCMRLRASMKGYLDAFDPKCSITPAGIFTSRIEELEFECVPISLMEQVITFLNDVREDLRCSMAKDAVIVKNETLRIVENLKRVDTKENPFSQHISLDFQKKITLPKHERQDNDSSSSGTKESYKQLLEIEKEDHLLEQLLLSRSLAMERIRASRQQFVLVASLLDRIPNLAGLARTCEVFKAAGLAIADTDILHDKQFQLISVTAEKWVPIIEVPVNTLKVFLEKKKREGFSILGLEQTANSIPLDRYIFPKKTVLVLGREKEGIPVDIIHILDACIEIPQLGVVRSLNVHVSGAIALWEYTRQQRSQ